MTRQELISLFVGRILEDLLDSFPCATLKGLEKLSNLKRQHLRPVLDRIERSRAQAPVSDPG